MRTQTKLARVAHTAVMVDGKRNEISAYRLGDGVAAKWRCAKCGRTAAMPKPKSDSILDALVEAKSRIYRHYERMHERRRTQRSSGMSHTPRKPK
jgi:hypothetical protein